jgi:hypothetical protein
MNGSPTENQESGAQPQQPDYDMLCKQCVFETSTLPNTSWGMALKDSSPDKSCERCGDTKTMLASMHSLKYKEPYK